MGLGLGLGAALGTGMGLSGCAGAGGRAARPATPATATSPTTAAAAKPAPPAPPRGRTPADETYQVKAADISDPVLRTMIGIATLSVGIGPDGKEASLQSYDQDGDRFTPGAALQLDRTHPISRFQIGIDAVVDRSRALVRRYPALARKGMYVEVALDPAAHAKAWLRRTPDGDFPNSVVLLDFGDADSWRCYQLDLFFLTGARPRKLFEKPDKGAAATYLSPLPGGANHLDADVVPLKRQGNYLSISALRSLDDPRDPIGWVELKDAKGRLTVWFTPGPDC